MAHLSGYDQNNYHPTTVCNHGHQPPSVLRLISGDPDSRQHAAFAVLRAQLQADLLWCHNAQAHGRSYRRELHINRAPVDFPLPLIIQQTTGHPHPVLKQLLLQNRAAVEHRCHETALMHAQPGM